jgi:hypothetical protein
MGPEPPGARPPAPRLSSSGSASAAPRSTPARRREARDKAGAEPADQIPPRRNQAQRRQRLQPHRAARRLRPGARLRRGQKRHARGADHRRRRGAPAPRKVIPRPETAQSDRRSAFPEPMRRRGPAASPPPPASAPPRWHSPDDPDRARDERHGRDLDRKRGHQGPERQADGAERAEHGAALLEREADGGVHDEKPDAEGQEPKAVRFRWKLSVRRATSPAHVRQVRAAGAGPRAAGADRRAAPGATIR